MRRLVGWLVGILALVGAWLWWQNPLLPSERAQVKNWLECEECQAHELDSAVALGTRALPILGRTLMSGPARRQVTRLRVHLQDSYHRLVTYQSAHGLPAVPLSDSQYVTRYLGNYEATYRVRSAMAVARIGGPLAKRLLSEATNVPGLRPDVLTSIRIQRDSVWHP